MNAARNRLKRKDEHLKLSGSGYGAAESWFEYVRLVHQAVNEISLEEIDIKSQISGLSLESLLIIDAITGGSPNALFLNRKLAQMAATLHLAISVGSQSIMFDFPDDNAITQSFKVIRKENPRGIVIANMSAQASLEKATKAIELLDADCIQLHLNPAQELFMTEGDRDFTCVVDNIKKIADSCSVPVIVKETGCGFSKETANQLFQETGVSCFNISGSGGSNFIAIENVRSGEIKQDIFSEWGIPTAASLMEMRQLRFKKTIIASGGIDTPLKAVKSLAMGANAVACAGWILKLINDFEIEHAIAKLSCFIEDISKLMLLAGAGDIASLQQQPFILMGPLKEWADQRKNDKGGYIPNEN